jgi:hypothetical protein
MNKAEKKEPLCETSERCEPILSDDELERMKSDVGRRIAEAFEYRSDREIACLLKTSCKSVNAFLVGEEFPSVEHLLLIHCVTGVSLDWILTGEEARVSGLPNIVIPADEWASLGLA